MQINSTDILGKRSVSFPLKKSTNRSSEKSTSRLTHCISHPFWGLPTSECTPVRFPAAFLAYTSVSSLSPQIVHNIAPGPATTPMTILPMISLAHPSTRVVFVRTRSRSQCAEGRRCGAHHSVPLQKVRKYLCGGEIMRGMLGQRGRRAGLEEYSMRDRCRHGKRVRDGFEEI